MELEEFIERCGREIKVTDYSLAKWADSIGEEERMHSALTHFYRIIGDIDDKNFDEYKFLISDLINLGKDIEFYRIQRRI